MKKIIALLLFSLVGVFCVAQNPLDSMVWYKYLSVTDSVPVMRIQYERDLWGQTLSRSSQVYDDFENRWELLSYDPYVYNNGQLIEVLTHNRVSNTWQPSWRSIYTYPEENVRLKEFYEIDGTVEKKLWETEQIFLGDVIYTSSSSIVNDISGDLVETFRVNYVELADGFRLINYRLNSAGEWQENFHRTYTVQAGLVTQIVRQSLMDNVWENVGRGEYFYNENGQRIEERHFAWEGSNWAVAPYQKQFNYYSNVSINPPELDAENLIVIYQELDKLYVRSKVDLSQVSIYTTDAKLIRRDNSPKNTTILWADLSGEYLVEVLTVDNRKKIEKILFK